MVVDDHGALLFVPGDLARAAHVVSVAVSSLDERMVAVRARVGLLLSMCLLVVDHIAELGRLDVTPETPEELVCSPSLLIDHIAFFEAHVARVWPVSVANALFNHLFEDRDALWLSARHRSGFCAVRLG